MPDKIDDFWIEFNKHTVTASQGGVPVLFRGEPTDGYELIPSLGRGTSTNIIGHVSLFEDDLISEFKRISAPVLNPSPTTDFEWLFLAQHYGLPTRLLDWSTNPYVGLFFAVEKDDANDASLYVVSQQISDQYELFDYRTADVKPENKKGILKVFALQGGQQDVIFIRPKYTDQRYMNQKSVFSCHSDPFKALSLPRLNKLLIKKEWKPAIRDHLRIIGIAHSYIYPSLEGVAHEVKITYFDPVKNGKRQIVTVVSDLPPLRE